MATAFPRLTHGYGSGHHAPFNDRDTAQCAVTAGGRLGHTQGAGPRICGALIDYANSTSLAGAGCVRVTATGTGTPLGHSAANCAPVAPLQVCNRVGIGADPQETRGELEQVAIALPMAFLCTFTGLLAALLIWVGLYTLATEFHIPLLSPLAPYLEALSPIGEGLFVLLAVIISLLIYRLLKSRAGNGPA